MSSQFTSAVPNNLLPSSTFALLRYLFPMILGAIIFFSEHGCKVDVDIAQSFFRKNRSEAVVISAYAAVGGCIFSYHSDRAFSGLLTLSAVLQSLGVALLLVAVTRGARRVSRESLALMALALACRLYISVRYNGYLPTDRSGDGPLQAIDALSLGMCCVVFLAHPRNVVRRMEVSKESHVKQFDTQKCPKAPPVRGRVPRKDSSPSSMPSNESGVAFPTFLSDSGIDGDDEWEVVKCAEVLSLDHDAPEVQSPEVQSPGVPAHALVALCAVLSVLVHPNLLEDSVGDTLWTAGQFFECVALLPQLHLAAEFGKESWHASFFGPILLARFTALPFWFAVRPELDRSGDGALKLSGSIIILAQAFQLSAFAVFAAIAGGGRALGRPDLSDFHSAVKRLAAAIESHRPKFA